MEEWGYLQQYGLSTQKRPCFLHKQGRYMRTSVLFLSGCFHRHCQAQTPPISLPLGIGITC